MNSNLKTRPKTDEELVEEMNRQLRSGVFYTTEQLHRLVKIGKEKGYKRLSDIPQELKEKVFSEIENEKQNSEE